MSFTNCLARLREEGVIDGERAARYEAEFDRLNRSYRSSMGPAAAADAASRDAMDALEFQALNQRRQEGRCPDQTAPFLALFKLTEGEGVWLTVVLF